MLLARPTRPCCLLFSLDQLPFCACHPAPQPPQISHDNALDSLPYELLMGVLGNKSQANGCNVSVTWFAMFYHSGEAAAPCNLLRAPGVQSFR